MAALQKLKETLSGQGGGWEKEEAVPGVNVADCVRTAPLQPTNASQPETHGHVSGTLITTLRLFKT